MQLHIVHDTTYRYDQAANLIIQALRMWPAPSNGQVVKEWRVAVDGKRLQPTCVDGFGNPVATHAIDRSVESVRLSVRGRVDTRDLHGVHGNEKESLPPMFYLASTPLTDSNTGIVELAHASAGSGADPLDRLHRLCNGVRDHVDYLPYQTDAETTAVAAFAAGAGVCQDHAHVLIAAARSLGFPARYVSGYLCPIADTAAASHAWAEIFVDDLGWVGFDAANRQSPDERYVRIGCGRDYRDAAPVRGVRLGGLAETLEVEVSIAESPQAAQ
ncbi:transglutaminase domain-containing protein [Rhodanobacter ginsengisoli]|uniref:Transglutaminase domain-containing protein n=1 Tax=Rhodanobacter ginsengisoli TaxID=418646 RepID=A0ABW0QP56_9GAMM